jgi:catechol 2,3-dioxygenase-like lactoylglutathione lyase family enzyme
MKRFHVHVRVADVAESVNFYSTLFAVPPTVRKDDYAKWMLDDPQVNFAISARGGAPGLDHLGIQVESSGELEHIASRLGAAGQSILEQKNASCCYARGDKGWISDPSKISWETFLTFGESTVYGDDGAPRVDAIAAAPVVEEACCAPTCCAGDKA